MNKVTSYRKAEAPCFTPFGWAITGAFTIEKVVTIDGIYTPELTETVAVFKEEAVADQALSTLSAFQSTQQND